VSAENTMQLLRERSRTITNLSMKRRGSGASEEAKVRAALNS